MAVKKSISSTINQRIVQFCSHNRLKQVDLVNSGYGSKQTINQIWNGKRKPGYFFLERFIAGNANLDARWLMTGVGKMNMTDNY